MIARDPLVLTATEGVEILSIQIIYNVGDVLSLVINSAHDPAWRRDSCDLQLRRGNHKTFVNEDVRAFRMIDDDETEMIVVVSLPKFGSDPQIVIAVVRHELIATDL